MTTKPKTYIAAEPEPMNGFTDQSGRFHLSRESALRANFKDDLQRRVRDLIARDFAPNTITVDATVRIIEELAESDPDMLRILVGDRDET